MRRLAPLLCTAIVCTLVGCSEDAGSPKAPTAAASGADGQPAAAAAPVEEAALVRRGKTVYMTNCSACHNIDPARNGALGPAVAGSSRALLEARVVHGTYPEGYTPARDTKAMVPLPHLAPEIDALTAYLNSSG